MADSKVVIQNVRCSYVYVETPREDTDDDGNKTGKTSYGLQVIIPKSHKQIKEVKRAIKAVCDAAHPGKKPGMLKLPLRNGDEERDGEEYEDCYFFNANSRKRKPGIVNRHGKPASEGDLEELCFSGAYFHVSVNFYAMNRKDNKGVAAGLNNVMLRKKGERLDGSVAASDEFADYADEGDDDDFDEEDWDDDDI